MDPSNPELPDGAKPESRKFIGDDGHAYVGIPADQFEDFSDVDHTTVDPETGEVRA